MFREEYAARSATFAAYGEGERLCGVFEGRFVVLAYLEFRSISRSGVRDSDERLRRSA